MPKSPLLLQLLRQVSWREALHHPWRNAAAVVAVMLGVALAFSTHLINASALSEFSSAVRSVNGQSDLELKAVRATFDESVFARVATHPDVALASPVLELASNALDAQGKRVALRVLGRDALSTAQIAPAQMARPDAQSGADMRFALFLPGQVFLNPSAAQALGSTGTFKLQSALQLQTVSIAGSVSAPGGPLAVMDIAAAQELFDKRGLLSRIELRFVPGSAAAANPQAFIDSLNLSGDITAVAPGDSVERISNLSRAYRVNLTVLALVALFTGSFLVFSVLALSVAKRAQQFALLAVLGLKPKQTLALVLLESAVLGGVGSALGVALGTGLAALALRLLGGDLGGGYFAGAAPSLQFSAWAALGYGTLGIAACVVGGWWPARTAQKLAPAQTLKGLGSLAKAGRGHYISIIFIALGAVFAWAPAVFGIPLAAYASVALLLVGGITALPALVALLYDRISPWVANSLLPMLAVERARRVRESAAVAVSGVVASLSLAVALTVMVASFRGSVTSWLDVVLPADLYARTAAASTSNSASETVYFTPEFVRQIGQIEGVKSIDTVRITSLLLDTSRPAVALISREIASNPSASLPLVGDPLPVPPGAVGVYVSEAMVDLYGAQPGQMLLPFSKAFRPLAQVKPAAAATNLIAPAGEATQFFVAGVWRDYARQFGSVVMSRADFERLTGDVRINDLGLVLQPEASAKAVELAVRNLADKASGTGALLEFASSREIRAISLKIFDRSFAVTYWLQGVAIAIGLFGVAASFSAQVLARRKEFGLLAHLGLTRSQILGVVAGEGAAWTVIGSLAGLGLGLAVSLVLVHVVNPQSFHWTMDWLAPWGRLLALCAAVVAAGTATAWAAGRAAAGKDAVLAVKEDW